MSNKQKTAVDIAFEKLANQGLLITRDYKNLRAYREFKEMEKEQHRVTAQDFYYGSHSFKNFEQYYEQTYGGGEQ
jgi:hypothetical protein